MVNKIDNAKISTITDLIVRKSNLLIESGTNMNLMEQRVILTTMAQIMANDLDFDTYSFTVTQLADIFGLDSSSLHKEVRKVSDSLMEKFFRIPKDGINDFRNQSVVDYIDYTGGVLSVKLADGLKSELINLKKKGHFTSYEIQEIVRLRRTSSMRLYELLVRDKNLARKKESWTQVYTLNDIREFLYIGNSYTDFRSFNQKILKPSIKEINENTSISVEEKPIRSGRVTSHIEFVMKEKNRSLISHAVIPENTEEQKENERLEHLLQISTLEQKKRFEEILKDEMSNKQYTLFQGSNFERDSIRFSSLQKWSKGISI